MRFAIRSTLTTAMGSRARWAAGTVAPTVPVGAAALALALALVAPQACEAQEPDPGSQEEQRFLEILRQARPAPQPSGRVLPESESGTAESRTLVGFDLVTGREVPIPSSLPGGGSSDAAPPGAPRRQVSGREGSGAPAEAPAVAGGALGPPVANRVAAPAAAAVDSRVREDPYRLLLRFSVPGGDQFYLCGASSADGLQLQTAGHCLYRHDPDGDGNTRDAGWANEVWAWEDRAAAESVGAGVEAPPAGATRAILLRSYRGWTERGDPAYDVGYVTLGRRPGD